jgi:hypothetical protein
VTSRPASAQHLRDLALPRRVRDRIDRNRPRDGDTMSMATEMLRNG